MPAQDFSYKSVHLRNYLLGLPFIGTRKRLRGILLALCLPAGFLAAWFGMQFQGTPEPILPEDHAALFAAETYAQGKLSNETFPGSFFLQTYLTLQAPSRVAAIAPGTSLLLAFGYLLGDPLYGLWLTMGLFIFTGAWMLAGFFSLRWTLLGTIFLLIWFAWLSYWGQTFSGMAAAGIGINLIWGALRRYLSKVGHRPAILFFLGLAWLWLCSPLVFAFTIPIPLFIFTKHWCRNRNALVLVWGLLFLVLTGCFQLRLNKASTGTYWKSAQQLYSERYNNHPFFLWQMPRIPPDFDFWRMEQYDLLINEPASTSKSPTGKEWLERTQSTLLFYTGIPGLILIMSSLWFGTSKWERRILGASIVSGSAIFLILPFKLNYVAPLSTLFLIILVFSIRRIWLMRGQLGRPCWALTGWIGLIVVAFTMSRGLGMTRPAGLELQQSYKTEITKYLKSKEGSHLVFVRYDRLTDSQIEYVYNGANLDKQNIIWARWHETESITPLIEHFKNRQLWIMTVVPNQKPVLRAFEWHSQTE